MRYTGLFATAAILALAAPAHGQDRADDETQNDIIIQGQKETRTLQDTPASVGVVTSEDITNRNLISVYDALSQVANVVVPANKQGFSIRGIDAFNVSGAGEGALASVYLDGAPLTQYAVQSGPLDLYDIAQVEVYRGPQSTLQGRNALAGAVIIRTTDPSFTWSGKARAQITDSDGGRRIAGAIGGPIIGDQLAFRVSGEIARADGFAWNLTRAENYSPRESETIRGKLLYTPSWLPDLKIIAGYMHDRHLRGGRYILYEAPYWPDRRVSLNDTPERTVVVSDIATFDASYRISRALTLSSVTNYSKVDYRYDYDSDWSSAPTGFGGYHEPVKTLTEELRLNFDFGRLRGLVGGYYSDENKQDSTTYATQRISFSSVGLDRMLVAPPPYGYGLPQATADYVMDLYPGRGADIFARYFTPRTTTNKALFGDATWEFVPHLKLNVGFRWDNEEQRRGVDQLVTLRTVLPDPASVPIPALRPLVAGINAQVNALVADANNSQPEETVSYSAFLPKAGLTWQVTPDIALSGTVQRGYRSGGSGTNVARAQYYTFDPEYTWNYEFALRTEWFDHKLTLNANVFRIDWKDQQVSVQLTPGNAYDTQTFNAGSSRLWGFELEARGRPARSVTVSAGLGYTKTEFTDFNVASGGTVFLATGNEFADAPRWTANGSITWQSPTGLFANVNANYRSAAFRSAQVQTVREIDARALINTRVGWQGEHFGAFVFTSNLLDKKYVDYSFITAGHNQAIVGDPRVVGLSFEARF